MNHYFLYVMRALHLWGDGYLKKGCYIHLLILKSFLKDTISLNYSGKISFMKKSNQLYFSFQLFQQLSHRDDKTILMILSQDCDLTTIKKIALENHFQLTIEQERANFVEHNFIFKVSKI